MWTVRLAVRMLNRVIDLNAYPLAEAQRLLGQEGRLTAIAVRLKDPARLRAVLERFRELPGTQVVTMTEMMGTFLRLLGTVRSLTVALSLVA